MINEEEMNEEEMNEALNMSDDEDAGDADAAPAAAGGEEGDDGQEGLTGLSDEEARMQNLKLLQNIDVKLTVEIGGTIIKIKDLLKLNEGSVVELDRLAGEHLDILVNGTLLAKGEVVMVGERFGIRFTDIISPEQRIRSL